MSDDFSREDKDMLTFGGHLDVLRKMLFRVLIVTLLFGCIIFCFKEQTFGILLAPRNADFYTFSLIERLLAKFGISFHFEQYDIPLINTELSAQFMTHITVSFLLGALLASPYILIELLKFISPALYEKERRYSLLVAIIIYGLFALGLLMSYFILFPISYRFLATYQVDADIVNTITLDSYISTFTTLTFMMGIVFQLPLLAFILGRMGIFTAEMLKRNRPYALVAIMIIAAIITPPDIFTLLLVTLPLYLLYEASILVLAKFALPTS